MFARPGRRPYQPRAADGPDGNPEGCPRRGQDPPPPNRTTSSMESCAYTMAPASDAAWFMASFQATQLADRPGKL